ncbi:FapA family protein [uncultured Desulfobacter sp.]|uniref:FapA family protein n=1 Tax=uncultured Desulfobacter sp. TaxID=240139 RepID=UPI0029F517EA|nr:FapA family protein [uncultured Desulfobacter sp.]
MGEDGSKQGNTVPLIGILAVKKEFISEEQLQKALAHCSADNDLDEQLKAYFLAENLISPQNVHRLTMAVKAVVIHQQEYRFGAIALARGFVNKSVMELALEEQKEQFKKGKKPRRIGDAMVEAGMITIKQRDEVLTLQHRSFKLPDVASKPSLNTEPFVNKPSVGQDAQDILGNCQEADDETSLDRMAQVVEICGGILLQVPCDRQSALLTKLCDMDPDIPAVVIRTALAEKGIVFGLASDGKIEDFIRSPISDSLLFRVAKGIKPSPGKDTQIGFFFNTDYLKIGGIDDFGNIDFKHWGPRPLVEKGTVLASKIAGSTPQPGKDVFGKTILAIDKEGETFRVGTGAVLSEDGQKVLATVKGAPRITLSGLIAVHEESDINGDIDKDTGPVEVDCNIRVTGSIKSGARVYGVDVSAQEVSNSRVEANGDLTIARGISEARVYARGNVYAQSITNSEIVCMGDVFVKKEIVDSTIECSGACSINTGLLISSRVAAKMGLMAHTISSGTAGPAEIKVGHDAFTDRELEKNRAETNRLEALIHNFSKKNDVIRRQAAGFKKQMTELDRARERILVKYREIESRSDLSLGDRDSLDGHLTELRNNLKAAETKMKTCGAKIRDLAKQSAKIDLQITGPTALKKALVDEKKNLIRWSRQTPGRSRVVVDGEIESGTVIKGLHSTFVAAADQCHIRIAERPVKSDDKEDAQIIYQMQVDDF